MTVFFDLGLKGAISIFENQKLIKVIKYELNKKAKKSCKEKILQFHSLIHSLFKKPKKITKIGCFKPLGTNRNTIGNLSMMTAVLIIFFEKSEFIFVNEWNSWKQILNQKKIPLRIIKKEITVKWAKKQFAMEITNDDVADAILGGYWISKYWN